MIKLFITISLIMSAFIAVIFPTEVGLADPLGLDAIRVQNFNDGIIDSSNLATFYTDGVFFDSNGNPIKLDAQVRAAALVPSEGDQSVVTDTGFGFLDYPRIVLNFLGSLIVFLTIPVIILFNMGYPLNILFSATYGGLFMFSILSYILGR